MAGILELSLFFVILGARGFTRDGLPFSARRRLAGATGKAVGAACLLFGLSGIASVYWVGDAGDRRRLRLIGLGIAIGVLGTFLVRPPTFPASPDEGEGPGTDPIEGDDRSPRDPDIEDGVRATRDICYRLGKARPGD